MFSNRLGALVLALVIAGSGSARAQDPPEKKPDDGVGGAPAGTDRTVNEGMLRLCPDLKDARGHKKEQLLALFFDLDARKAQEEATQKTVRGLFDLSKKEDATLLEGYLNAKGTYRCSSGMRTVVAGLGADGLFWALHLFETIAPQARGRLVDAVSGVSLAEGLRFLVRCLDDKTVVPDPEASQKAPPGYSDLRVCDHALRVLVARLENVEGLVAPKELQGGRCINSLTAVAARDDSIATLEKWLAGDKTWKSLLAKQPSALEGLDEARKKEVGELLKRLKVGSE